MSQYADGGIIASKPYAASANYISSMSDYCASCSYEAKRSEGNDTCLFNSLYWDFFDRNKPILEGHPRLGLVYSNWRKQGAARKRAVKKRAEWVRSHLGEL